MELDAFKEYMELQGKKENTIKSYLLHIKEYLQWFTDSFNKEFDRLYRTNVLDYISYLKNIKKDKHGKNLNVKTINAKISALIKYNEFLIDKELQTEIVITKRDTFKFQRQVVNPLDVDKKEIEAFRQLILEKEGTRNYAIVTIMAYAGLRISECLDLKINDINITARELVVRSGKGEKQRIVYLNDKIINAVREYLKERQKRNIDSDFLFLSRQSRKVNGEISYKLSRSSVNKIFNKYSKKITPHTLRHFYCTNALESGYSVHEVANQAGHASFNTTMIYTNPTRKKMKDKANLL